MTLSKAWTTVAPRIAIESRRIWRTALRIAPHRHTARPYPEGYRLPEWEWQKPKPSKQKQD
jgi:hypothetical protein